MALPNRLILKMLFELVTFVEINHSGVVGHVETTLNGSEFGGLIVNFPVFID